MFSAIRSRITYVNVVATLVLVFAMTGGALAAKKYLITSTKQISPSVLKSLQGKAGAAGANGAQGPAGTAGPAGPQGAAGAAGVKGDTGSEGKEGKEGKAGKDGKEGKEGKPWTAGGTLPGGKTETGAWAFGPGPKAFFHDAAPISFTIPLVAALANVEECGEPSKPACRVHYINTKSKEVREVNFELVEEPSVACHGSAATPTAEPGNLCVYAAEEEEATVDDGLITQAGVSEVPGASTAGAVIRAFVKSQEAHGWGTWAVTGEE